MGRLSLGFCLLCWWSYYRCTHRFIQRPWFLLLLPIETSCPASAGSSHNLVVFRYGMYTPSQRPLEAWCGSVTHSWPCLPGVETLLLLCSAIFLLPAWRAWSSSLCCYGGPVSVFEEHPVLAGIGQPFPFESPWGCELSYPPTEVKSCPECRSWGWASFGCR